MADLLKCQEELLPETPDQKSRLDEPVYRPEDDNRHPVKALVDAALLKDERVLKNLLRAEAGSRPAVADYMTKCQPDLTASMRKIVTDWMLQVCQECGCAPDVFIMAVNFMDRFLAVIPGVPKNRLQLIGSVCLLISSKFKETVPLPGERLIFYTDYSITPEEIRDYELLILQHLQWDISSVTSLDFLDHFLARLDVNSSLSESQLDVVKLRMETVLALVATEYTFTYTRPSLLAAAAVNLVLSRFSEANANPLDEKLPKIARAINEDIFTCTSQLADVVPNYLLRFSPSAPMVSPGSKMASSLDSQASSSAYGSSISSSTGSSATIGDRDDPSYRLSENERTNNDSLTILVS